MSSADGCRHLVFNGEIYNHRVIRRELLAGRALFRGHSDTEVLVEALAHWDTETVLRKIEGMFAIAVVDSTDWTLTIARDRLGEKPLYWYFDGRTFAFASELRALRQISGLTLTIDDSAAAALLRWGFIPHPHTIYSEVRQVPPGATVRLDLAASPPRVSEHQWWSFTSTALEHRGTQRSLTLDQAAAELRLLLFESVEARLESDVPLGAFLSGGIDSSLVAAAAQSVMGSRRLKTFTVSMPPVGLDEAGYATAVAHHLGTDHQTLSLAPSDALDIIARLPQMWDEPFADPSMLPSALLCQAAARHVTVCLGGDGGDELFAGYNRHALGSTVNDLASRLPSSLRTYSARAALRAPGASIDWIGRHLGHRSIPNLGDKVQKAAHLMLNVDPVWDQLAGVWPASAIGVGAPRPNTGTPSSDMTSIEKMLLADSCAVLPDQMLVKVDRASMAASLEVRSPLLDTRIVEWAWSLPMDLKTSNGTGKIVMRRLAHDLLPTHIASRRKLGFDPPLARWLRTDLRSWATELLSASQVVERGWLNPRSLQVTWQQHLDGKRNWEYRLWSVLMLEAWLRQHHP